MLISALLHCHPFVAHHSHDGCGCSSGVSEGFSTKYILAVFLRLFKTLSSLERCSGVGPSGGLQAIAVSQLACELSQLSYQLFSPQLLLREIVMTLFPFTCCICSSSTEDCKLHGMRAVLYTPTQAWLSEGWHETCPQHSSAARPPGSPDLLHALGRGLTNRSCGGVYY